MIWFQFLTDSSEALTALAFISASIEELLMTGLGRDIFDNRLLLPYAQCSFSLMVIRGFSMKLLCENVAFSTVGFLDMAMVHTIQLHFHILLKII